MIYTVRTVVGQERMVADLLLEKISKEKNDIYAVVVLDGIRGYIMIEAGSEAEVRKAVYGIPHVKGLIKGSSEVDSILPLLEAKPLTSGIDKGDLVELISGPFKTEKARVVRVETAKDEVTLELVEAVVPIPVTVKADTIRVVRKAEEAEKEKGEESG